MEFPPRFDDELRALDAEGLTRRLRMLPAAGGKIEIDGRTLLNFSSNDYLNLANDARLKRAAQAAVERYGCGATASRLMAGHLELHAELEAALAQLTNLDATIVFPSGYQANLGAITTLAGEGDAMFSDALNHASIIDGCRLSRADVRVYRHLDLDHLEDLLRACNAPGWRVIVTDTVFSMDGDLAPVRALRELADRYDALLVVDEAHALGIYGRGSGLCTEHRVRPDALVANLSKALGSGGGFVAGSPGFIDLLVNRARSFIFSTGLAPACAGSALEAVRIVQESPKMGTELLRRAAQFRHVLRDRAIEVPDDASQIIPVVIGPNEAAMDAADTLYGRNILVSGIRPPSVPEGTARLRLSVTLAHEPGDLVAAADAVAQVLQPVRAR